MRGVVAVSLLLALATTTLALDVHSTEWELFKSEHGKVYDTPEEEQARLKIFLERKEEIKAHNELYEKGLSTYWMGINHLSDMTHEEVRQKYKSSVRAPSAVPREAAPVEDEQKASLPSSVDWRKKNLVTAVKNQGSCGGCWAFSTTGAVEGQMAKKTGKLVSLSEQQMIDCTGNMNCANGGWMTTAYQYIEQAGGLESEQEYPFTGKDHQTCKFKKNLAKAWVTGFVDLPSGSEQALTRAVAEVGPIAVGMDARASSFDNYAGGIYDEPKCSSTTMDHGVLVVGYGSEKGSDYYIVKNSWGPHYGEKGYIRIARNKNNKCALATAANYPKV